MRDICGRMYVRNLYRSSENQQQGTTKSKNEPPGLPVGLLHVTLGLLFVHLFNYNVTPLQSGPHRVYAVTKEALQSQASALGIASSQRPWALRISSTISRAVPSPARRLVM